MGNGPGKGPSGTSISAKRRATAGSATSTRKPASGSTAAPAPAPAPDKPIAQDTTPGEEFYGFVGTRSWGFASDVRIDITRKFDTARATGTIELYTQTVDECAGEYGDDPVAELGSIDVTVTGTGPIATFRGHGSYKMPSEFGGHENYRGKERAATGSVVAGGSIDTTFAAT